MVWSKRFSRGKGKGENALSKSNSKVGDHGASNLTCWLMLPKFDIINIELNSVLKFKKLRFSVLCAEFDLISELQILNKVKLLNANEANDNKAIESIQSVRGTNKFIVNILRHAVSDWILSCLPSQYSSDYSYESNQINSYVLVVVAVFIYFWQFQEHKKVTVSNNNSPEKGYSNKTMYVIHAKKNKIMYTQ